MQNGRERIIQLVSNAGDQLSERCQLFRLPQCLFGGSKRRDVLDESLGKPDHASFVVVGAGSHADRDGRTVLAAELHVGAVNLALRVELFPETLPKTTHPGVNDWYERMMARPAAKFVYAAGSPETPKLAPQRTVAGIREFRVVS